MDNVKMKKEDFLCKSAGFTLVEILVVIAIVAILGTIMVAIFTNTLRGSNKSQILAVIKQNGQAVLDNIDKSVRNADNIVCPQVSPPLTSVSSNTLVIVKNGVYTRYRITLSTDATGTAPSSCIGVGKNGCLILDNPTLAGSTQLLINQVCSSVDPMSGAQILSDTNSESGVSIKGGLFTRNTQAGSKDSIGISFTLGPGAGSPTALTSQMDPVTFQTTVELR